MSKKSKPEPKRWWKCGRACGPRQRVKARRRPRPMCGGCGDPMDLEGGGSVVSAADEVWLSDVLDGLKSAKANV